MRTAMDERRNVDYGGQKKPSTHRRQRTRSGRRLREREGKEDHGLTVGEGDGDDQFGEAPTVEEAEGGRAVLRRRKMAQTVNQGTPASVLLLEDALDGGEDHHIDGEAKQGRGTAELSSGAPAMADSGEEKLRRRDAIWPGFLGRGERRR